MPVPRTFAHNAPLLLVRRHLSHTHRELRARPVANAFVQTFVDLLATWSKTFQMDFDLEDQVAAAAAEERSVDSWLNRIARMLSKAIDLIVGDGKPAALRSHYFEGDSLHVFIRPILSGQLATMRKWLEPLAKSEHKAFNELGLELGPLIVKADAAVAARGVAEKALDEFRRLGARKAFIDEVNTKRKEVYTGLAALPQSHHDLPSDFAEGFFRRDRSREEDPTIEGLEEEVKELQDLLAGKEQALAKLRKETEEAAKQQKDKDKDEKKKKLAQVQKDLEERQKEAAALAAELDEA